MSIADLPEIRELDTRANLLRIPDQLDVPLTPRVRHLIDTPEFRRLASISQLGLVGLVYPAANHTRFEHSLGVYRMALLYLKQLAHDERFAAAVSPADAEICFEAEARSLAECATSSAVSAAPDAMRERESDAWFIAFASVRNSPGISRELVRCLRLPRLSWTA